MCGYGDWSSRNIVLTFHDSQIFFKLIDFEDSLRYASPMIDQLFGKETDIPFIKRLMDKVKYLDPAFCKTIKAFNPKLYVNILPDQYRNRFINTINFFIENLECNYDFVDYVHTFLFYVFDKPLYYLLITNDPIKNDFLQFSKNYFINNGNIDKNVNILSPIKPTADLHVDFEEKESDFLDEKKYSSSEDGSFYKYGSNLLYLLTSPDPSLIKKGFYILKTGTLLLPTFKKVSNPIPTIPSEKITKPSIFESKQSTPLSLSKPIAAIPVVKITKPSIFESKQPIPSSISKPISSQPLKLIPIVVKQKSEFLADKWAFKDNNQWFYFNDDNNKIINDERNKATLDYNKTFCYKRFG